MEETGCAGLEAADHLGVLSIFAVIFIVPFVQDWPYQTGFSMEHFRAVFQDAGLMGVYKNSLYVALLTAVFGTLAAYGSALITAQEGTLIVNTEQMEQKILICQSPSKIWQIRNIRARLLLQILRPLPLHGF